MYKYGHADVLLCSSQNEDTVYDVIRCGSGIPTCVKQTLVHHLSAPWPIYIVSNLSVVSSYKLRSSRRWFSVLIHFAFKYFMEDQFKYDPINS